MGKDSLFLDNQIVEDLEKQMREAFESVPCGLCIYRFDGDKIVPVFHNQAFYEIMGYSKEHILLLEQETDFLGVHPEDLELLKSKIKKAVLNNDSVEYTYRVWNDVKKEYRWIRAEGVVKPRGDKEKLLYAVYTDVNAQKELEKKLTDAQQEMAHLVNSIPGGIASYRVEGERFIPTYYSDGVMALSGHTREDYAAMIKDDALDTIYEPDRKRVQEEAKAALISGEVLDVSYRMLHKNGNLIWIHLNGRRIGPLSETPRFYAAFTGMTGETLAFQSIANETADGIYVIDKETYELLYINEAESLFAKGRDCVGQKCYEVLHGQKAPCGFCALKNYAPDGESHELKIEGDDHYYSVRFKETYWNGIPAYIQCIRDITEEVSMRREKERLEQYFQTVVENLPGGIAVVHFNKNGVIVPEYLSEGFADMTGMTLEEAWNLYQNNAMAGVHPDDLEDVMKAMDSYIRGGDIFCEIVYRLKKGCDSYIWVKNTLSLIQDEGGGKRVYAVYHDMTKEREEQEELRQKYKDLIMQHYRMPGPNTLIAGHCNITRGKILDVIDYTDSGIMKTFSFDREQFFKDMSDFIVAENERQIFFNIFLKKPALAAFEKGEMERSQVCFVKFPGEPCGRYARIKMNMVTTPDSGDVTGILTITDITEQIITDRILDQISVIGYEMVADIDLLSDSYKIISVSEKATCVPKSQGSHSKWVDQMLKTSVVPRDRAAYRRGLEPASMAKRLEAEGAYTIAFSVEDENGEIHTKNMTVSATDLKLGRVCVARTDITASMREQQGLLNMIAYTFELAGFIEVGSARLTMYTRQTVLENLAPYVIEDYNASVERLTDFYNTEDGKEDIKEQFRLKNIIKKLNEKPEGYDFLFRYQSDEGLRYKQVNVLWGDESCKTICMVRADVTDMLMEERRTKTDLEKALMLAKEANQAKSNFLSDMSHDIRTPMNAIMGMTALAIAQIDNKKKVSDCLQKISISSKHLLSLINDILDMSKIERSKITLNHMKISLQDMMEQLSSMMEPQARESGIEFHMDSKNISHPYFYGDMLRINQILINILSNAVKFTPEGGTVEFFAEELGSSENSAAACYCFTIRDTGIGMSEDVLAHIFDSFARGQNAAHIEGTGLGLSITKGLVNLMGGRLSVESKVNKGSTFRVELECEVVPADELNDVHDAEKSFPQNEEKLFSGCCFLIAEDNAINGEILCELLSMFGAVSVIRDNGEKAVKEFEKTEPNTYDAILMDIQMPVMNGYEATRMIRNMERDDAHTIPIVAMTANAFAEDIQASKDAGMTAHIAKPIDVETLRQTLKKALTARGVL